ncbi:hypothetical protein EBR96_04570 [bacterium]|nr:hypothetical protein [bacterium]
MAIYSKRYLSPKTIDLFFKNRWIVGPLDPGEMLSPIKFLWQMNMATPHQLTMPHYIRLAAHILRSKSTDKFCAEVDQFLAAHLSGESEKTEVPAFLNALKSALGWIKKEYPEISGADHLDILSNALQSKIDKLIPAGKRGKKEVSRPPFITRMTQVYRCWAQTLSDVADTTFGNSEIFDLLCQSMGIAIGIPLEAPESTPPLLRRIEWHLICRYNSASGAEKQDLFKILEAIPGGIFNPAMASYKSEEWTRLAPKIQQMAEATNTAEWMGPVVRADIALLTSGQLTRGALLDRLLIRIAEKPPIERSRWIQAFWKASGWRSGLIPEEKSDQLIAKLNFSDKASVKLILQQLSAIPEAEGFIMELENRFPGVLLEIPDRIESLVGLPLVARAIQSELLRRLQLPEGMAENAYRLTREEIHLCMNAYLKSAHLPKAALSVLEARAKAGAGKGVLSSATFSAFKTKSIFDPITTILLAKAIETGSLGPDLVSEAKEIVDRSEEGINPESAMVIYRKWILNTVSIKQSVPFRIIEDVMTKAIKYGAGLTRDELRTVLTWQTHFLSKHRSSQKKLGPLAVKLIGIIHHTGPKTDDWKLLADSWAQLFTKPEAKASFFMDIWTILFRNPDRIEEDPLRQCVLVSSKVVLDLAELAVRLIGPCPEPNAHYTDIFRSIASLFVIIRSVELNESDIYHGISGEIAPALFKIFAENKMWGGVLAMSESVLLSNHPYALAEHLGLYIDGYRLLDDSPIGKRFKLLFADLVKWVVPNRAVPEIYSIIASIDCDGDVQIPDLSQLGIRNLETREIVSTYHPEALMQLIAGGMEFLPSEEELDSISESYIVNFPKIEKQLKINFGLTETVMILLKDAAQFKIITHKECARLCYDSIEKLLELFETESFSHANVLAAHDALAASGAPEALSSEGILLKERVQLSLFRAITSFIDFVSALFVTGFNKYIVFNIGFGNQLFLKSDFEIPRKTLAKLPGLTNRYLIAAGNSLPENLIGKDAGLVLACVMQSIPEKESLDIVQRHRDFFVKNLIAYECFLKQLQDYQLLGLAAAIPSIVNPTSSVTSAAEAVAFSATGTV